MEGYIFYLLAAHIRCTLICSRLFEWILKKRKRCVYIPNNAKKKINQQKQQSYLSNLSILKMPGVCYTGASKHTESSLTARREALKLAREVLPGSETCSHERASGRQPVLQQASQRRCVSGKSAVPPAISQWIVKMISKQSICDGTTA